jgi:hypothetical protein
MKKQLYQKLSVVLLGALCTTTIYSNIIWPALFVSEALGRFLPLVIISIFLEALCFSVLITDISRSKALLMSFVGNIVSTFVGMLIMPLIMISWHLIFDSIAGGTFNNFNNIATIVIMCLGSAAIEILALKLAFKYHCKDLWVPVLAGNIATYVLIVIFLF